MSSVACGEPLSLTHLPVDRVIRLAGVTANQLAVGVDPPPDGAPVVLGYQPPAEFATPRRVGPPARGWQRTSPPAPAPVDYPALAGRPHPASAAEQTLERCLARCAPRVLAVIETLSSTKRHDEGNLA